MGGDGAGKTTSINELNRWLSKKFDAKNFHLGKPPRSPVTLAVITALRLGRLFEDKFVKNPATHGGSDGAAPDFPGYLQLLRWVCAARDRHRLYVKIRRFAISGGLAVCDRYPVPQLRLMDGPNIGRSVDAARVNPLVKFLLKTEDGYYRQIMPPELLFVLRVEPEIAAQRKRDESEAHVRARSQELWEIDWRGTHAHVIDAGRPSAEVIARLRSAIWAGL